ncbi:hypothetical protein [Nostoc sp.]|uniref:hypothetical protein n=1 Tax=Nostoc sp. TaxID=1180 RepID=UPI002FFA595D
MANKKPCVVDLLPDDIREAVDAQLSKSIPAPAIAKWLVARGHKVTARQIYGYKANTVPKAIPTTLTDPNSYNDYSDADKLQSPLKTTLVTIDTLNDSFKVTGDLSTVRALREMIETASGLLKYQLQYSQPDPVVNVSFRVGSLEEEMGVPEYTEDYQTHYGNNQGNLPHD